MKDKFNTSMTPQELIAYIRKCPKQYLEELPAKVESWGKARHDDGAASVPQHSTIAESNNVAHAETLTSRFLEEPEFKDSTKKVTTVVKNDAENYEELRCKIFAQVAMNSADGRVPIATTVEYAIEVSEEVIKQLKAMNNQ